MVMLCPSQYITAGGVRWMSVCPVIDVNVDHLVKVVWQFYYRVTISPLFNYQVICGYLCEILERPPNFMGQNRRGFPFRKWTPSSCRIDPAASLRQYHALSIKLREREPFRKG